MQVSTGRRGHGGKQTNDAQSCGHLFSIQCQVSSPAENNIWISQLSIPFIGGEYREIITECIMLIMTMQVVTSRKEGNWWDFPNWGNSSKQIANGKKNQLQLQGNTFLVVSLEMHKGLHAPICSQAQEKIYVVQNTDCGLGTEHLRNPALLYKRHCEGFEKGEV